MDDEGEQNKRALRIASEFKGIGPSSMGRSSPLGYKRLMEINNHGKDDSDDEQTAKPKKEILGPASYGGRMADVKPSPLSFRRFSTPTNTDIFADPIDVTSEELNVFDPRMLAPVYHGSPAIPFSHHSEIPDCRETRFSLHESDDEDDDSLAESKESWVQSPTSETDGLMLSWLLFEGPY